MRSAQPSSPMPFVIAGVDEVGRGPLAGPVVAAAVVLDGCRPVDGLDDSKRLVESERERLDVLIRARAVAWCVASASVAEIDEINILHASMLAMQRAVQGLSVAPSSPLTPLAPPGPPGPPAPSVTTGVSVAAGNRTNPVDRAEYGGADAPGAAGNLARDETSEFADPYAARTAGADGQPQLILVDGNRAPALPYRSAAIVGGDARVASIAAASIIAKVARDRLMRRWHERYPAYGFAAHKGYATKTHRDALQQYGATPLHRRSYAPVQAALARSGGVLARPLTPDGRAHSDCPPAILSSIDS